MISAVGNNTMYTEISYPARFEEVIAVGSTGVNDFKASTSQYSADVDIMAPGHNVFSTLQSAPWYQGGWSGTSFASPTVASAIALMKSYLPSASNTEILGCLYQGADNIENIAANTPYIGKLGHGRLNIYRSMLCMQEVSQNILSQNINDSDIAIFPNPAYERFIIKGNHINGLQLKIFTILGALVETILITQDTVQVNISNYPIGIYYVSICENTFRLIKN